MAEFRGVLGCPQRVDCSSWIFEYFYGQLYGQRCFRANKPQTDAKPCKGFLRITVSHRRVCKAMQNYAKSYKSAIYDFESSALNRTQPPFLKKKPYTASMPSEISNFASPIHGAALHVPQNVR